MKHDKIKILTLILCLSFGLNLTAQTDSSSITNTETGKQLAPNYLRSIRYLDMNMNNEERLFKVAVPLFTMGYKRIGYSKEYNHEYSYLMFQIHIIYERKISPSFSFYTTNVSAFSKAHITGLVIVNEPESFNQYFNAFDFGGRYYFLLNSRIKRGLSGNNLYGTYLGAAIEGLGRLQLAPTTKYELYKPESYKFYLGIQNRLNNWSFLDISCFARLNPNIPPYIFGTKFLYSLGFNLKIGLAKSFK